MGKKTNLELHGNTWRVTVSIPVSLREIIGKSHFKESLNTSDLDEAARLKHGVVGKYKKLIETYKKIKPQKTLQPLNSTITS
ncbi:MAG: hypothetical protein DIZ80_13100 [endosymbiont of Galathealinum brachiosum]|uniref:DUF6538 domain-containing protein n=1 Tax=endosymbiont of Galathealinum brachiosum TaxID=2200906 RepID=A0A370D7Z5_9GAMM|nr:MAG: hypothetical protein DIZ80_13100 [endosymbiont of Galathealinum brachiosum]